MNDVVRGFDGSAVQSPPWHWLIAALLFLSGSNVLNLIVPFGLGLAASAISLFALRPARIGTLQFVLFACVVVAAIGGMFQAEQLEEIAQNLRQIFVVGSTLILVSTLGRGADDVLRKFLLIFAVAAAIGITFYAFAPEFRPLTAHIGPREYSIGPSSTIFDSEFAQVSFIGPYRFQGLFDEPGSFASLAAAAIFFLIVTHRWLLALVTGAAIICSQGLAGIINLTILVVSRWLLSLSPAKRLFGLAVLAFSAVLIVTSTFGERLVLASESYFKMRALSSSVRSDQVEQLISRWTDIIMPTGFAESALTRLLPESITVGFGKTLICYGIFLTIILFVALVVALFRLRLSSATGTLLVALALSGTSRFGVFDLAIGWFVLFVSIGAQSGPPIGAEQGPPWR